MKKNKGNCGKSTYAGRIQNGGQQVVQPIYNTDCTKKGKVLTGDDLRTGKK